MLCCLGDHNTTEGSGYRPEVQTQYGWYLTKGLRWSMEDMHVAEYRDLPRGDCVGCFAIYDGHGGRRCVQYVHKHLFNAVIGGGTFYQGDVPTSIKEGYDKVDKGFKGTYGRATCGSTATTVLQLGQTLWIAHVGDSRAILCTGGKARQLTVDHNPKAAAEASRMAARGAPIVEDSATEGSTLRVGGVLAVTRAFGNNQMKDWIQAEPEVLQHEVGLADEFLVIASDGLWDVLTNDDAVKHLAGMTDAKLMAEHLALTAYGLGSSDNISVLVIRFNAAPCYSMSQRAVTALINVSQRGIKAIKRPAKPDSPEGGPSNNGSLHQSKSQPDKLADMAADVGSSLQHSPSMPDLSGIGSADEGAPTRQPPRIPLEGAPHGEASSASGPADTPASAAARPQLQAVSVGGDSGDGWRMLAVDERPVAVHAVKLDLDDDGGWRMLEASGSKASPPPPQAAPSNTPQA